MSANDADIMARAITALPLTTCYEFVAYPGRKVEAAAISAWPARPGQALRDAAGRPALLHFAPDRWLVPAPAPILLQELSLLERAEGGILIDVEGKWQEVHIAPERAHHMLSRSIDIETVLAARECAAVVLFDCPAMLARSDTTINLWIATSYLQSFLTVSTSLPIRGPGCAHERAGIS
jgi:sarcosine oxidase gamma subunit